MGNQFMKGKDARYSSADITASLDTSIPYEHLDITASKVNDQMIQALCDWIDSHDTEKRIKSLLLGYNHISSVGGTILFQYLKRNSAITIVNLSGNTLDDECMKDFGEMLIENKTIQSISFGDDGWGNSITDKGVEHFAPLLHGNISLRNLNLSSNIKITDNSLPYLQEGIAQSRIELMSIKGTSITNKNALWPYLTINMILNGTTKIHLHQKDVKDPLAIKIAEAISNSEGILIEVSLRENRLTSEGIIPIVNSLLKCPNLLKLDLSNNTITDDCMPALAELLTQSNSLQVLCLDAPYGRGLLTDAGAEILLTPLIGNTTLNELLIYSQVKFTEKTTSLLKDVVTSSYITKLGISPNREIEEEVKAIKQLLHVPKESRQIPVFSNSKSAAKSGRD